MNEDSANIYEIAGGVLRRLSERFPIGRISVSFLDGRSIIAFGYSPPELDRGMSHDLDVALVVLIPNAVEAVSELLIQYFNNRIQEYSSTQDVYKAQIRTPTES